MRTITEIYDELVAIKEGSSSLDGLLPINENSSDFINDNASGSKVAVWRLWLWIVATANWVTELIIERHKEEIAEMFRTRMYGTLQFYHAVCFDFQLGYDLAWNGSQYAYSDTTSQVAIDSRIIKRASVVQTVGQLQFKVAKIQGVEIEPLTSPEESAFKAYLTKLVYPGTNFVVISEFADDLRIDVTIYFNPLKLAPDGSLLTDSSVYPVNDSINAYVRSLPFNGRLNLQHLVDKIQATPGVEDLVLHSLQSRYGGLNYTDTGREYTPFAGHMLLSLSDSVLNFEAYV